MDNDLKILIEGKLDFNETKNNIKQQLQEIQKSLSINFKISDDEIDKISKQISEIQKKINNSSAKIVSDKDANNAKEFFTDIGKAVEKYKQLGTVNITKNINPATKEIDKFSLSVERADGKVEKLRFELAKLNNIEGIDGYILKSQQVIDKTADLREKQLKEEQKINKELDKQNEKLKDRIESFKREAEYKAKNLKRRYGSAVDDIALNNFLSNVRSLSIQTPDADKKIKDLKMTFNELSATVRTSSSHMLSFGEALSTAMVNFAV